jgi:hypothetical protein
MPGWQHERRSRHARGYGAAWNKARAAALSRDKHLCQPCQRSGRVTQAAADGSACVLDDEARRRVAHAERVHDHLSSVDRGAEIGRQHVACVGDVELVAETLGRLRRGVSQRRGIPPVAATLLGRGLCERG